MLMALAPRCGGGKDGCARGGDTSSSPPRRQWLQPCITAVMWGRGLPDVGARPVLLMEPKVQARVVRHTGVGYELVQALKVSVLHGLEVADDINDRATLQLLRGLALVPQERVQHGSVEQVSSFGVQLAPHDRVLQRSEQVGVVHGMVDQVVDVPARGAEIFHVPPGFELAVHTSLRTSSWLRRSMWMTAATHQTNSSMMTSCRLASGLV